MLKKRLSPDEIKKKALSITENKSLSGANDIRFLGDMFSQRKTDIKQASNGYQTDNKQVSNGQQTDIKENSEKEKRISQGIAIRYQTDIKTDNKRISDSKLEMLVGYEKKLLLLVNEECRFIGDLITPPITNERIRETLKCSMGMAKLVIHRLVKKGFIKRHESKTGRGGWTKFSIPKELYQKLNQISNGYQLDIKGASKGLSEGLSEPSSSSSNISIINKTTTKDAWSEIDITPLEKIGFTDTHVKQIISSEKSSPELLKKSIEYFTHMVETDKTIEKPILLFMKAMRNEGAIAKPVGYKTKLERNIEILEQEKKAEQDKIRKYIEENYETLTRHPSIIIEKEKLFQNGFMKEDSVAYRETLKGILASKLQAGDLA